MSPDEKTENAGRPGPCGPGRSACSAPWGVGVAGAEVWGLGRSGRGGGRLADAVVPVAGLGDGGGVPGLAAGDPALGHLGRLLAVVLGGDALTEHLQGLGAQLR